MVIDKWWWAGEFFQEIASIAWARPLIICAGRRFGAVPKICDLLVLRRGNSQYKFDGPGWKFYFSENAD